MTLENLVRIGRLKPHEPTSREVLKLVEAAERNLTDAANETVSVASRYTCAYSAVMQCAQAALFANGYRPSTSEPGHHGTMVQALVHSIGLDPARMRALDSIRHKRNVIDYEGAVPQLGELADTWAAARKLLDDLRAWLATHRPDIA